MNTPLTSPDENIAATVVASMLDEKVFSSIKLTTGDQHFVCAVQTKSLEYVLRMTKESNRIFLSEQSTGREN